MSNNLNLGNGKEIKHVALEDVYVIGGSEYTLTDVVAAAAGWKFPELTEEGVLTEDGKDAWDAKKMGEKLGAVEEYLEAVIVTGTSVEDVGDIVDSSGSGSAGADVGDLHEGRSGDLFGGEEGEGASHDDRSVEEGEGAAEEGEPLSEVEALQMKVNDLEVQVQYWKEVAASVREQMSAVRGLSGSIDNLGKIDDL